VKRNKVSFHNFWLFRDLNGFTYLKLKVEYLCFKINSGFEKKKRQKKRGFNVRKIKIIKENEKREGLFQKEKITKEKGIQGKKYKN